MPPPRVIRQPEGSSLCGQACVAMAAGVSLDRAIKVVGHEGGTTTAEVREALRDLGVGCADKLRRISRQRPHPPKRAVLAVKGIRNWRWHWVLTWDGEIYDPAGYNLSDYKHWKITSYLEIYA